MMFEFNPSVRSSYAGHLSSHPRAAISDSALIPAAVAIVVTKSTYNDEACFLLTRRAKGLKRHSGQYALPGGRLESGESTETAALRELEEELGLTASISQVAGQLDDFATRSGFRITPVVVWLDQDTNMTLDPLAAKRPEGGLFMWSEQGNDPHKVTSGHPRSNSSSAAAVLSYDVPHNAPWDWRVSLYTWTKSISAGAYIVPGMLLLLGHMDVNSPVWTIATPLFGLTLLAVTGVLLIWDLEHPERFYMISVSYTHLTLPTSDLV